VEYLNKLEKSGKFEPNLSVQKILSQVYGSQEPYQILRKKPHTVSILKLRLE
jgi:hypothetical protein